MADTRLGKAAEGLIRIVLDKIFDGAIFLIRLLLNALIIYLMWNIIVKDRAPELMLSYLEAYGVVLIASSVYGPFKKDK